MGLFSTLLHQHAGGLGQCPCRVGHVIQDDSGFIFHIADHGHGLCFIGSTATLVYDGQPGLEPFCESARAFHAAGVGGDHNDVVPEMIAHVLQQYRCAWPVLQRKKVPAAFFVNTAPALEGCVSNVHKVHWMRAHTAPEALRSDIERMAREENVSLDERVPDETLSQQYRYDDIESARLKYLLNFQLPRDVRDGLIDACFRERFDERELSSQLYMKVEHWRELALVGSTLEPDLEGRVHRGTGLHLERWPRHFRQRQPVRPGPARQ